MGNAMPGNQKRGGNIMLLDDYRGRRKLRKGPPEPPGPRASEFDEATRDLHAAASSTLKFIYLVRDRLGLPQL
jgi:hypothetical protein